jgi:hypothetical protein
MEHMTQWYKPSEFKIDSEKLAQWIKTEQSNRYSKYLIEREAKII